MSCRSALAGLAAISVVACGRSEPTTEAERRRPPPPANVWFGNVERIAAERIGRETVTHVSSIYK